jgi:hypothetical protein
MDESFRNSEVCKISNYIKISKLNTANLKNGIWLGDQNFISLHYFYYQVYVPIEDENGHWFLMVIHIPERRIYHLDTFMVDGKKEIRRQQIKKVVSIIT